MSTTIPKNSKKNTKLSAIDFANPFINKTCLSISFGLRDFVFSCNGAHLTVFPTIKNPGINRGHYIPKTTLPYLPPQIWKSFLFFHPDCNCWYRILTGSAMHCMGRRPISFRCITASRESHPAPKIYLFYVPIIAQGKQKSNTDFFCFYFLSLAIFMVRPIRFFATSTESTCTSTTSPTLTASKGCLIKRSVIWEI